MQFGYRCLRGGRSEKLVPTEPMVPIHPEGAAGL